MKRFMKLIPIFLCIVLISAFAFTGCARDENTVVIATKNYTEQRLLGQMIGIYIEENSDYDTQVKDLGGTMLCYEGLKRKEIDVYAEYTGTAYGALLEQTEKLTPQATYDYVKQACEEQDGITWLDPLGYNNTYVLSVSPATAAAHNLETISDLIPVAQDLTITSDNEFMARHDGIAGLKNAYGLSFKSENPMDQGLTYQAVRDGEIDINTSFSTDGRIAKFGLVNLEDDLNFFVPYYVTPILRMDYAERHPELVELLRGLKDQWTDTEMQGYNLAVDEGGDVKTVARKMLTDKGLIGGSDDSAQE